jgi:hypothetical protein
MNQQALDFSRPPPPSSAPIRDAIKDEVRTIVLARKGAAAAITGAELAAEVGRRLDLDGWLSQKTLQRRCQEGVAALVAAGEPIASTSSDGYFVAETAEEIEAGRRDLGHRLGSLARRYRAFDRATADRILELLGQQVLDPELAR